MIQSFITFQPHSTKPHKQIIQKLERDYVHICTPFALSSLKGKKLIQNHSTTNTVVERQNTQTL